MLKMQIFECESHQHRGRIQFWENQLLALRGNGKEKLSSERSVNLFSPLLIVSSLNFFWPNTDIYIGVILRHDNKRKSLHVKVVWSLITGFFLKVFFSSLSSNFIFHHLASHTILWIVIHSSPSKGNLILILLVSTGSSASYIICSVWNTQDDG